MATCRGAFAGAALVEIRGARARGCGSAALLGAPQGLLPAKPDIYTTTNGPVMAFCFSHLVVLIAPKGWAF